MKYWVILIVMVMMTSCGFPGRGDFSYPVAGKYMLYRNSAHMIFVAPMEGWNGKAPVIKEKVIEIAWNNKYIVAKKQDLTRRSSNNVKDSYMEPVPNKYSYWILDAEELKVFGPLSPEEMDKMKSSLGINLVLKDVYSYNWMFRVLIFLHSVSLKSS